MVHVNHKFGLGEGNLTEKNLKKIKCLGGCLEGMVGQVWWLALTFTCTYKYFARSNSRGKLTFSTKNAFRSLVKLRVVIILPFKQKTAKYKSYYFRGLLHLTWKDKPELTWEAQHVELQGTIHILRCRGAGGFLKNWLYKNNKGDAIWLV
jgi:hypothetical protein